MTQSVIASERCPLPEIGTVTVIVPTFNERDNIGPLLTRLDNALPGVAYAVLFVDDSTDDTPEVIQALAARHPVPVHLLHRVGPERAGGLGGAVLAGLREATGDWVVVMDADLQHPPESVPQLLAAAAAGVDVVVASRYVQDGSAGGLASGWRRLASSVSGNLARTLFPRALRGCADPMSGFFAVRRGALPLAKLRPDGFKILLEILARGGSLRVREVPFVFAERTAGASKAGLAQGMVYLRHLLRLRLACAPRLVGFLAIGASGLILNVALMVGLGVLGLHYLAATVLATLSAITWNFHLGDTLLFRARRVQSRSRRYAAYLGVNSVDLVLRLPLMTLLVGGLAMGVVAATLLSTVAATLLRFVVISRWIYGDLGRGVSGERLARTATGRGEGVSDAA